MDRYEYSYGVLVKKKKGRIVLYNEMIAELERIAKVWKDKADKTKQGYANKLSEACKHKHDAIKTAIEEIKK